MIVFYQKQDVQYKSTEEQRAKRRKYYLENRERLVEKTLRWQKKNPEKVKEGRVKFKIANPNWRKDYYEKNPEKFAEMRFKSLMWRIGVKMTYEEFKVLLKKQNGGCAICRKIETKRRISVDHCHKTGRVRGLLCQECNTALGLFKDNPESLKRAINYLKK